MRAEIFPLRALDTNYIWILREDQSGQTFVIDPSLAQPVEHFLSERGWSLTAILNTHHHHDHIGGNLELKAKYNCPIYGYSGDAYRIPGITHPVNDNERLQFKDLQAEVFFLPGHTLGLIAFYFAQLQAVFVGDCLFALGCGRLFEGTAAQLYTSLQRLGRLPRTTQVYCGHEYALDNAPFAETYLPHNSMLRNRISVLQGLRKNLQPAVPFSIGDELDTNPFYQLKDPILRKTLKLESAPDVDVFTELRKLKDAF